MREAEAASERSVSIRRKIMRFEPEAWLAHLLSDRFCGNDVIPGTTKRFEFGPHSWPDYATTYQNDGELWIGTDHEWHTNMSRYEARRLAWWILWDWWAKGEWFGFKRWAWFQLLHRHIARWQAAGRPPEGSR